jgi:hypothetical protein
MMMGSTGSTGNEDLKLSESKRLHSIGVAPHLSANKDGYQLLKKHEIETRLKRVVEILKWENVENVRDSPH